jgi:thiamine biosynthesis lipoprotein
MIAAVCRRARPALGTLVELGARPATAAPLQAAFDDAFHVLSEVEGALSAFNPASDIGRFNQAPAGASLQVTADTLRVLTAAMELSEDGLFDVTLGTGAHDWSLSSNGLLHKHTPRVRIDLGGIGKGHAVDRAFEALQRALDGAPCWVNAGGDLRVSGLELPVKLRDEVRGGVRPWMVLREGALATSYFGAGGRSRLAGARGDSARHVSVAAPLCLSCDALTKVVAVSGRIDAPILARHGATAWLHQ